MDTKDKDKDNSSTDPQSQSNDNLNDTVDNSSTNTSNLSIYDDFEKIITDYQETQDANLELRHQTVSENSSSKLTD